MTDKWYKLTNKYNATCVKCGEWIPIGETIFWLKGLGIKHETCDVGFAKDDSRLIVLEDFDHE